MSEKKGESATDGGKSCSLVVPTIGKESLFSYLIAPVGRYDECGETNETLPFRVWRRRYYLVSFRKSSTAKGISLKDTKSL